jgi:hypothetical protein
MPPKEAPPQQPPKGQKPQMAPPKQEPKASPVKKEKPQPKVQKDETLKFQMSYANGGFNNGIEIKPAKDGKLELSITIYGGGENKKLGISGYSPQIQKLVQAYEVGASTEQNVEDITKNLKQYFERVNQVLSLKVIEILQQTDNQIKEAIKQTFKEVK